MVENGKRICVAIYFWASNNLTGLFVVNSYMISWNSKLFRNTVCNHEYLPEETCAYVFPKENRHTIK